MKAELSTTWTGRVSPDAHEQDRIAQILDEYLRSFERGEVIEPETFLARHPDVADQLRTYLSGLALIHQGVGAPAEAVSIGRGEHGLELRGQLGDFRLIREIGRGGMGIVYEALQVSLGRRVAVKVLPFAAAIDEKQITRFKNEAQAAAQVDHPHIVPVFAIGQDHGIHFFAMQLITGRSLSQLLHELRGCPGDDVADSENATVTFESTTTLGHVRAVARLGIQAAEALHAAHEIGVVHRDVKPSNLLLDGQGKLWVTDFGLARCQANASPTETGQVLGTKRYMSPEQALGQAALVDHRTDVYSLGVTLYELATLRHPYEDLPIEAPYVKGATACRQPRYWNRNVPVDFENIVMKAMAETREERYATARELAEDLQRFLAGEPILARRPSWSTRVNKWTRRHMRSVVAAMAVLALVSSGLLASVVVISRERAEKDAAYRIASANHERAERNYEEAQAKFRQAREMLDGFGSRVAQRLATVPGAEEVRRGLLSEMLPYYRDFAREAADESDVHADLALTFGNIGYLSDQLGRQSEAEQAYEDAGKILEVLVTLEPSNREYARSLGLCLNNLGQVLQKRGDLEGSRNRLERALAIQQRLVDASPKSIPYRGDLATTQSNLALLSSRTNDDTQAAQLYRAAIAVRASIARDQAADETNLNNLAASYNNLSSLYNSSQPSLARELIEQAMSIQANLARKHPTQLEYQSDLALSYNNLGALLSGDGKLADATRCYSDAITIQDRLVDVAPLVTTYQRDLAASYNNLGMAQSGDSQFEAASASFEKALQIQSALAENHSQDLSLQSGLAGIHNNLGMLHQQQGRLDEACGAFEQAIAKQKLAHERAPKVAHFRDSLSKHYYNYAQALRLLGQPEKAAEVSLARRELWTGDADRLLLVAQELAETCKQIPASATRERFVHEASATLQLARDAGLTDLPDMEASPFDVLSRPSTVVSYDAAEPTPSKDESKVQ